MSKPNSSDDVQTTIPTKPDLNRFSVSSRASLDREPWCIWTGMLSWFLSTVPINSDSSLVFVNNNTEEEGWHSFTNSTINEETSFIEPSICFISTSYFLRVLSTKIAHFPCSPEIKRDASLRFPIVAEMPILQKELEIRDNRSMHNDKYDPLLEGNSSWTSSIITHSNVFKRGIIFSFTKIIAKDSGVVIKISGGFSYIFLRLL